ncbi:hypothetical protein OG896_24940 [Streptomyces sp. NBC_00669]|uniref:hypothetical protein n=1 Tax=Streptomyces sp. NBC_00669 TaxID=2976011 RepID=UPI002E3611AF|nr:hypothetical protein [Streptomyces sp. NBC_00669]
MLFVGMLARGGLGIVAAIAAAALGMCVVQLVAGRHRGPVRLRPCAGVRIRRGWAAVAVVFDALVLAYVVFVVLAVPGLGLGTGWFVAGAGLSYADVAGAVALVVFGEVAHVLAVRR